MVYFISTKDPKVQYHYPSPGCYCKEFNLELLPLSSQSWSPCKNTLVQCCLNPSICFRNSRRQSWSSYFNYILMDDIQASLMQPKNDTVLPSIGWFAKTPAMQNGWVLLLYTSPSYNDSADTMVSSLLDPSLNSAMSRLPFSSLSIIRKIFLTRFSGVSSSEGSLTMLPTIL